jgi:FKBP-type peptidyl-prolyl cis-trans isomerase
MSLKKHAIAALVVGASFAAASCTTAGAGGGNSDLETQSEKASYAIGLEMGASLHAFSSDLDLPSLIQGITDTLTDRTVLMESADARAAVMEFARAAQEGMNERRTEMAEKNLVEGQAYLASNGDRDGVVTTATGLQYEVITAGDGASPTATDQVTVHYRGTLIDDTQFDSSYDRNEPATFPVNGVIPGWTEGLQQMKVGGKSRLVAPSELAYGEAGSGPVIGPNATLVFEVELLSIQ